MDDIRIVDARLEELASASAQAMCTCDIDECGTDTGCGDDECYDN